MTAIELLNRSDTCRYFGGDDSPIDQATLYRGMKTGRYPRPILVGLKSKRWIKSECKAALDLIIAERDAPVAA